MKFKPGDIVVGTEEHTRGVRREIVSVRETGYTWRYHGIPAMEFETDDLSDPFMSDWAILDKDAER